MWHAFILLLLFGSDSQVLVSKAQYLTKAECEATLPGRIAAMKADAHAMFGDNQVEVVGGRCEEYDDGSI
jgi:hypothetical protein